MIYQFKQLYDFATNVFLAMGCDKAQAELASDALLSADLRGVDSHGVARLSGYVRLWKKNRIRIPSQVRVVHETPSTATVDGGSGLGMLIGQFAMQKAIEKAAVAGSGWVGVKNSNHFGIAGFYSALALKKDMIGIAMTNASPLVAPSQSTQRLLGTNPVAIAIPSGTESPFELDMATTTAANGKLEMLSRKNMKTPSGWIQDKDGQITTDPDGVKKGGALLPLGGIPDHGSHKGYGLGAAVDILSGVLSGANFGPWVPPFVAYLDPLPNQPGEGLGHFFGAMRIDAFGPAEDFKKRMDLWLKTFRNATPIQGFDRVLVPGDIERETSIQRMADGIELLPAVVDDLKEVSSQFGIDFPAGK